MKKILIITIILFLTACSAQPQKYYYNCQKQKKATWEKVVKGLLFQMGYTVEKIDSAKNTIIFEKLLTNTGTTDGMFLEFLQLHISYKEGAPSELIPYYVTEQNANRKTYALSDEQKKKFEPEILKFIERMNYYCDPRYK